MWQEVNKKSPESSDEKKIRHVNFWYVVLVVFIVVWMGGSFLYLNHQTHDLANNPPVAILDAAGGIDLSILSKTGTNQHAGKIPLFTVKETYEFGDTIIIKYFYVKAVVLGKSATLGDSYEVIYKDHNHVLQKIILPRMMLLAPEEGTLPPSSLLVD
jgi:hypothetical protein